MAKPTLSPASTTSAVVLTSTGSTTTAGKDSATNPSHYPFGLYVDSDSDLYDTNFSKGASDQVAFTYKKLGGDILDICFLRGGGARIFISN